MTLPRRRIGPRVSTSASAVAQDARRARAERVASLTTPASFRHESLTDEAVAAAARLAGVAVETMRAAMTPGGESDAEALEVSDEDTSAGERG